MIGRPVTAAKVEGAVPAQSDQSDLFLQHYNITNGAELGS